MNADMKRIAKNNSGALFDVAGPTSLGSLPRGPIVPRTDSLVVTGTAEITEFPVGARTRTHPIPDDILVRGNDELRKRNVAAVSRIKGVAEIAASSTSSNSSSGAFLSQSLENPTKRRIEY